MRSASALAPGLRAALTAGSSPHLSRLAPPGHSRWASPRYWDGPVSKLSFRVTCGRFSVPEPGFPGRSLRGPITGLAGASPPPPSPAAVRRGFAAAAVFCPRAAALHSPAAAPPAAKFLQGRNSALGDQPPPLPSGSPPPRHQRPSAECGRSSAACLPAGRAG